MFISPKIAIAEGWITHPDTNSYQEWEDRSFISPNAIDFTLDKLFTINNINEFVISEQGKQMRGGNELNPVKDRSSGIDFWQLMGNSVYDGMSNMFVKVPDGVAVQLIIRSTFNRNGIFLTSGLYDSGYEGHIGFALHNRSHTAKIGVGTRVGQIIFIESDNATSYAGGWNHKEGTHHSEDASDD